MAQTNSGHQTDQYVVTGQCFPWKEEALGVMLMGNDIGLLCTTACSRLPPKEGIQSTPPFFAHSKGVREGNQTSSKGEGSGSGRALRQMQRRRERVEREDSSEEHWRLLPPRAQKREGNQTTISPLSPTSKGPYYK